MPEIVAFVSPKGGCGATSVCGLLWYALSDLGYKVLGLDMCFEDGSLDFFLGKESDYIYTLFDVLDGNCQFNDICTSDESSFLRGGYDEIGFGYAKAGEILKKSGYDYILADCRPGAVPEFADRIVLVTDTSPVSVRFCEEFAGNISDKPVSVVINKIVPRFIDDRLHLTVDEIMDTTGCNLLGLVPMDMYVNYIPRDSVNRNIDISCLYSCALNIASRITGKSIPAYDIDGFFRSGRAYKYFAKGRK